MRSLQRVDFRPRDEFAPAHESGRGERFLWLVNYSSIARAAQYPDRTGIELRRCGLRPSAARFPFFLYKRLAARLDASSRIARTTMSGSSICMLCPEAVAYSSRPRVESAARSAMSA